MFLNKLIYDDAYGVAIHQTNDISKKFYTKYPDFMYWYADPFICSCKGENYVFVEAMEYYRGVGRIAVAPINNNTIGEFKVVIKEPFHLSFPNIFFYKDEWFMIPESGAVKQIRLYRCVKFPYEWELDTILLDGKNYVDTVFLFFNKDEAIVIAYDVNANQNDYYVLSMLSKVLYKVNLKGELSTGRAGGSFFIRNGSIYRSVQDCVECYGDFLHLFEIKKYGVNIWEEVEKGQLTAEDLQFDCDYGIEHIHTYNKNNEYEIVDFRYRKLYPLKLFARMLSKLHIVMCSRRVF